MTTYAELITTKTAATLRDELLARLSAAGFPVTAWQSGNVARTQVAVDVQTLAELYELVVLIGKGWSLDDAAGAWLTLHAYSRYDAERILATYAKHTVRITVASGAGPYTITPGQLVLSRGALRYRSTNTGNVTISSAATTDITVQCETAGTDGNSAPTATVTPALAGVTWTWVSRTLDARNEETDGELRQRCRDRWATLATGFTREAVRYYATNATLVDGTSAGCTRVGFAPPAGDGSYVVYVAGASGPLGSTPLARVQAALDAVKPITDTPVVTNAISVTVAISGTVRFFSGYNTGANQILAENAAKAYVNSLPLGDTLDPPVVDEAGIKAAIYAALPGKVRDIDLSTADATLVLGQVAVPDTSGLAYA